MSAVKYEYQSDFAKKYVAEGRVEEARRLLLAIMTDRHLGASEPTRARIDACTEPEILERWVLRATSAATEREVFEPS